jgi:hypothetical protein
MKLHRLGGDRVRVRRRVGRIVPLVVQQFLSQRAVGIPLPDVPVPLLAAGGLGGEPRAGDRVKVPQ